MKQLLAYTQFSRSVIRGQYLCKAVIVVALASSAAATTTDTTFLAAQTTVHGWIHGSLGAVIRTGSLLVGMAVAVRTQRIYVAVAVGLTVLFFPDVVETIFAGTL